MKEPEAYILVNERKSFLREPKHALCYCVATAAGVATAVGAVASVGTQVYSASQKGKGAGGGGSPSALYGSKIKPVDYENHVNLPKYDGSTGIKDYLAMLPDLRYAAAVDNISATKQREKVLPGSRDIMQGAGANLIAMSRGQIRSDTLDLLNQQVAERTGSGADPSSPDSYAHSGSQGATDFARMIGRTSQDTINNFLSVAPTWESLADKFVYKPHDVANSAIDLLKTRNSYILGAGELQKGIDENMYTAELNKNRTVASPDPQAVGARNDALLQQSVQQMSGGPTGGYLTAINGLVSGLSGLKGGGTLAPTSSTVNTTGLRPGPQPGTYYL